MKILNDYKNFLIARGLSLNYLNIMRIFLAYLSEKKIEAQNITQETITNFFNNNSTYSISTKNQFIKAGRNFYLFLGIENNEWTKIKLMRTERKIPNYLTEEELEKGIAFLITYHSKRMTPIKIRALLHFLFFTGSRKQEVLILKRENFNFTNNSVKVYGKNKKERMIFYSPKIGKEIQKYFESEPEKNNAFNITLGKLHYIVKLMGKYLNKHIYLHLLRHSYARNLVEQGVSLGVISRQLGHSSILTTQIYASPDDEMCKRILNQLWKKNKKK